MARVRRAIENEAQTLARLGAETFTETFGHLYRREDLSAFLEESHSTEVYESLLSDPSYALWVVEDGAGAPNGYCVAGPCSLPLPTPAPGAGELARLYLAQSLRGQGVGAEMLDEALAWLKARYHPIFLSVYFENIRAQRLYASRGFKKVHEYFYMVGSHADPEWIMELQQD